MKIWKKIKSHTRAAWRALNEKDITKAERTKDLEAFNKFFDKIMMFCYVIFGIFGFISLSLFTTRVIL